jgi:predicted amidohydrolase YtcJ
MIVDTVFRNGSIRTLDARHPTAHAMAVLGGRIVALDDDALALSAEHTVDLGGSPVVPGFNDVHHHVSHQGERLGLLDAAGVSDHAQLEALIRPAAEKPAVASGEWIEVTNFDHSAYGGRFPDRRELDAMCGDRPLWMMHASGHLGVANTAALMRSGIDLGDPPAIDGGRVETDGDGRVTGVLAERAMPLVTRFLKPRSLASWADSIARGARSAVARGVTSATDTGVIGPGLSGNGPVDIGSYQLARDRGDLPLRMTLMPEWTAFSQLGSIGDEAYRGLSGGIRTGFGDDRIRIGAVKFFADGSLLGMTAAVSEPFVPNGSIGDFVSDREELRSGMIAAHRYGWQLATHAIGDRAVDFVLDCYEEAQRLHPRSDSRHRIEHTAVCTDESVARIARGGFVPVPQSHFVGVFGDAMWTALGDERVDICYRQRSFLEAGISVPGSSDCPVVDGAPLLGIHDLVNRRTPTGRIFGAAERLTPQQALEAYTIGSAHAQHQEDSLGTLVPGHLADFVALSDDLLTIDPEEIASIRVEQTVVGGDVVFERGTD